MTKLFVKALVFISIVYCVASVKPKSQPVEKAKPETTAEIKKILEEHEQILSKVSKSKAETPVKIKNYSKPKFNPIIPEKEDELPKLISYSDVEIWAQELSEILHKMEKGVVRRDELIKGFGDTKMKVRDGAVIVNKMATDLEDLLSRRARAAEEIMLKAEDLTKDIDFKKYETKDSFRFDSSIELDEIKETPTVDPNKFIPYIPIPPDCRSLDKVRLTPSKHFGANMSLDKSSVHIAAEVFDCDPRVKQHLDWSEKLLSTFQKNYAQDATTHYQYFCSAQGFLRHYPAARWPDMFNLPYDKETDIYDCRLRPWYVSAEGAPRDILILLDASGSMTNSSNQLIGEQFTLALLSALTDDDHVNVLRFNVEVKSPISCFEDKLVPANHVNSAAIMAAMYPTRFINTTYMDLVLKDAVELLQNQHGTSDRPPACQQAIVLLTDSVYKNYTYIMRRYDPHNRIRLFIFWLHDPFGLRDSSRDYSEYMTCDRDGYFAELITHSDVTEQVMRLLRVLERPLVAQRKERLRVFSDVYAHVEDPRRSEQMWKNKESEEQAHRYRQLRRNKAQLLSPAQRYKDHMHQYTLDKYGYYYEEPEINYQLQISVSVPVFEHTTLENITVQLQEEKQRNSTRTYPVNRLLGVVGVDIPIDQLKLLLPYHQLGGGGSLFILDHRGNIVLHENIKSTFDGDILRPGYRTVDFLDLEQPAVDHFPRVYPTDWLKFRRMLIIEKEYGNMTMYGKNIFEGGLRVNLEMRDYHWRRVLKHYTAVVVLPPYNRHHLVPETTFTKKIAEDALKTLEKTEFAVQPDWLYCRHVDPHFDNRVAEALHFIRRRSDEPNFAMKKLRHEFSPFQPTLLEKPYQCDQELMAKLCKEAIATEKWAKEHDPPGSDGDCATCKLGGSTAFFASESGLTRWHQYHATSQHAPPPSGALWPRGPTEPWYRRAVAKPALLVVHLPLAPRRALRNTFIEPPPLGARHEWLTAARALATEKGFLGVAGFHFHPQHLVEVLIATTEFPCNDDDKSKCKPRCDESWSCMLVDEGGWVVARDAGNLTWPPEVRDHLATQHPAAMAALLDAGVFQLNSVHDYQAVCFFPPWSSASMIVPSLLKSVWYSVTLLFRVVHQIGTMLTFIATSALVTAETRKEKEKRRKNLKKNYAREMFDSLYDPDVIINRTIFATCDRHRPFYQLQQTPKAMEALSRTPTPAQLADCSWPVVGAVVPGTNLVLLALYKCQAQFEGRPPPSPLHNQMYPKPEPSFHDGIKESTASQVACRRNNVPLPGRPPSATCYPHDFKQEAGYRQCGPWLPDPKKEDVASSIYLHPTLLLLTLILIIVPS